MKYIQAFKWHLKRFIRKIFYSLKIAINPIIIIEGVKIILKRKWSYSIKDHIIRKDYETGEINIIKGNLLKEDIVLEIGTGLGFLAIFCSKIVGQENVTSIEANPYLENYHKEIFELNNEFPKIIYNSIGNNEDETVFYIDEKNFWSSSLIPFKAEKLNKIIVKNIDLNSVIDRVLPTFLIVDVEGFEYELISMIKDYKNISKIQIETHPQIIGQEKIDQMSDVLFKNGFKLEINHSKDNQYYFVHS